MKTITQFIFGTIFIVSAYVGTYNICIEKFKNNISRNLGPGFNYLPRRFND